MKTTIHDTPQRLGRRPRPTEQEIREELQALRLKRNRALCLIIAIEKSEWYAIKGLPEQREQDLKAAQAALCETCKRISEVGSRLYMRRRMEHLRKTERLYNEVLKALDYPEDPIKAVKELKKESGKLTAQGYYAV